VSRGRSDESWALLQYPQRRSSPLSRGLLEEATSSVSVSGPKETHFGYRGRLCISASPNEICIYPDRAIFGLRGLEQFTEWKTTTSSCPPALPLTWATRPLAYTNTFHSDRNLVHNSQEYSVVSLRIVTLLQLLRSRKRERSGY